MFLANLALTNAFPKRTKPTPGEKVVFETDPLECPF